MRNINDFFIENGILKEYKGNDADVMIPDSVTEIAADAFYECINIKNITIPDGVTLTGGGAFLVVKILKKSISPTVLKNGRWCF